MGANFAVGDVAHQKLMTMMRSVGARAGMPGLASAGVDASVSSGAGLAQTSSSMNNGYNGNTGFNGYYPQAGSSMNGYYR